MPCYDYSCPKCETVIEITHSMADEKKRRCKKCKCQLEKLISRGTYIINGGLNGTISDYKQSEHTKKVKDPERAVKMRKHAFGSDAVGDPGMTTDPRHVIRRGKTLGGSQKDIDKKDFIKAAAKDNLIVDQCIRANKESKDKK